MKNRIILTAFICLSLGPMLKAQSTDGDPREKTAFGIKAGANYSNVWDEQGQDFKADPKIGFAGGLFLAIPLGEFLGVQPEILFSQKGLKAQGTLLGSAYSFSRTTSYIDIPIQLQVKPIEFLSIVVGPQYSYLMQQKDVYTLGMNSTAQEQEFNNDNLRKNILGFVAGADILIKHIVVSARMGWDLQTNNGDGTSSTPRYKNQWLQFAIGFKM